VLDVALLPPREQDPIRVDRAAAAAPKRARPVYIAASAHCLSAGRQIFVPNCQSRKPGKMRAEAEALVEAIKQSVGLLRRHL
jgi:hypothetical protein